MPGKLKNTARWIYSPQVGILRLWVFDENGKSYPIGYVEQYDTHCSFWIYLAYRDLFTNGSLSLSFWQYKSLSNLKKEIRGRVLLTLWKFLKRTKELT